MGVLTSKLIVSLIDQVSAPARAVRRAVTSLKDAQASNRAEMDAMRGRMVDATAMAYLLAKALSAPIKAAMEFESAMANVRKVVDFPTPEAFKSFKDDLIDLSRRVPVSVNGLAQIAAAAGQAGIAGDQLLKFTEAAAKIGVAFDITEDQAGDSMAKLMTGLGLTLDQVVLLSDAMNQLSNAQASGADEILDIVRRVGADAKQFGFAAEEVAAFGSAMVASGAESEVAATTFRNMGAALTRGASATKRQRVALKTLGLDAKSVAKSMQKDAVGTTLKVLDAINRLPKETQAAITRDLFGGEARAIGPLVTNLGTLREALGLVSDESSYAGSSFKEFDVRAATMEGKLRLFQNRILAMSINIGNALLPVLGVVFDKLGPVIDMIGQFASDNPGAVAAIASVSAALVALSIAAIGTRWAFLFLKGGVLSSVLLLTQSAGMLWGILNPLNAVKNAAIALRAVLMFSGIGLILAVIAAAGVFIMNNWEGLVEFFKGVGDGFVKALEPVRPIIEPIAKFAGDIFNAISKLLGPINETKEGWRGWGEVVGGVVGEGIRSVIAGITSLIDFLASAYNGAVNLGTAIANIGKSGPGATNNPSAVINGVEDTGLPAPPSLPARRAGGLVQAGMTYEINEGGQETFTPGMDGYVHNAADSRAARRAAGAQSGRPTMPISVQFGDIVIHGVQDVDAIVAKIEQKLNAAISGLQSDIEYSVA